MSRTRAGAALGPRIRVAPIDPVRLRGLIDGAPAAGLVLLAAVGAGFLVAKQQHYGLAVAAGVLVLAVGAFRLEASYAALVIVATILPKYVGTTPWVALFALVTLLSLVHAGMSKRFLSVAMPFGVYCLVYILSAMHAGPSTHPLSFAKYLGPPIFAAATALVAQERRLRVLLLRIVVVACLVQIPFALVQGRAVFAHPSSAGALADHVTGLLTSSKALGDMEVIGGVLLVSLALAGVARRRVLLAAAGVLFLIPVLGAVKAAEFMIPVGLIASALAALIASPAPGVRRRAIVLLVSGALTLPAFVVAETALYRGSGAVLTSTTGLLRYLNARSGGGQGAVPGRGVAIRAAINLTTASSPATMFLGRGPGVTALNLSGRLKPFAQQPDLLLTPAQETNGIWIARTLVESGILGLMALLALLVYLVREASRGIRRASPGDPDLGLLIALPGVVMVTFIATFENNVLSLAPVATVFWLLAGIGMAAAAAAQARPASSPMSRTPEPQGEDV